MGIFYLPGIPSVEFSRSHPELLKIRIGDFFAADGRRGAVSGENHRLGRKGQEFGADPSNQ
jgi:hypothetical protein